MTASALLGQTRQGLRTLLLSIGLVVAGTGTAKATLFEIGPDQALEVRFNLSSTTTVPPANALRLRSARVSFEGPESQVATSLFDGALLLGVDVRTVSDQVPGLGSPDPLALFKSASSPLVAGEPTVIDFTTIGDWSIDGLLRIKTAGNDAWSIDLDANSLQLIRYSTPSLGAISFPTVTSVVVAPEPSTSLVVLWGLAVLSLRRVPSLIGRPTRRCS